MDKERLYRDVLPNVTFPARYTGNELNAAVVDHDSARASILLAFPDVYEVGMSYIGFKILYSIVNSREGFIAERAFAPWPDMEEAMRTHGIPLYGLESLSEARRFDLIGFTLQYELSYSNVVNMLDLAGVPRLAAERRDGDPVIVAGGPCVANPEPVADFFDLFALGDGEELIVDIMETTARAKEDGVDRDQLVRRLAAIPGMYCPALGNAAVRRVVTDLDAAEYPEKFIVPFLDTVHDRVVLEVMRGCCRGCRFCQAGMIYRPVRERSLPVLCEQAERLVASTGYEEMGLLSLSTADYTGIQELARKLVQEYGPQGVAVSLPSLRVDSFSIALAREVEGARARRTGLTFAPEAGTQRMRDIINKGVTEEDLMSAAADAFRSGWEQIKLYFMIGLPYETDEDVIGIAELARKVLDLGRRIAGERGKAGRVRVNATVSSFVPKPHTPFQWHAQDSIEEILRKQQLLKEPTRVRGLSVSFHDVMQSHLEAAFARGDRSLGAVISKAVDLGCRFDGWVEHFRPDLWKQAFESQGLSPESFANRAYSFDEALPWDKVNMGVSKAFLRREAELAAQGITTEDCREGRCTGCGACFGDVRVRLQGEFGLAASPSDGEGAGTGAGTGGAV
ncbi:MAG: TIGR03960 family B12-binding radical SAM protein [Firmicutes bacterium]|nr:TIGR03960 family B12-binding radical SAM protein [Bacillota bacterium]